MTELSREEVEDLARSQFESAMAFGVSLDNFVRLGVACYEAGAKSERTVSDRLLEALKDASADLRGYEIVEDSAQRDRLIAEVEAMRKENG